ncbi:hypothetical protein ACFFU1_16610 [Algibacter miyuki]|uniref:Uncharacterized protein n=1 Tax=Algibacter miyuki TaxID=1306933 RepID=A0ABV5H3P0_9FLAO|nr:hypothetical protein [Algibacter miyuki]MDN3665601.1 hypothetical protein [Algibacter miyuki]
MKAKIFSNDFLIGTTELNIGDKSMDCVYGNFKPTEFLAFCQDQRNDDVLFEIRQYNHEEKFAISHLTWTSRKEKKGYPKTKMFKDFDKFKFIRMNPDRIDWGT